MWTSLLLALALGGSPLDSSAVQDRTATGAPKDIPHPDMPADRWTGRRYTGGGVTVTTRAYWAYVTSEAYPTKATCVLPCNGNKHLVHQQCDTSCDSICTTVHRHVFAPEFEFTTPLGGGAPSWAARLAGDIANAGGRAEQASRVADAVRDAAMKTVRDKEADYTYTYQSGHWNETACSSHAREFRHSVYSLFSSYNVVKDGRVVANADTLVGTVKIPHPAFRELAPVENCACQIVQEQRRPIGTDGNFLPSPSGTHGVPSMQPWGSTTLPRFGGLFIDKEGDEKYAAVGGGGGETLGVTASVELRDLNNFMIRVRNQTAQPVGVALMPGTTFDPEDDDYQEMVNLDLLRFTVPPLATREFAVPRSGPSVQGNAIEGYMACLDMAKKQPDGRAKYGLGSTTDSVLLELGHAMSQQRFRGPWNQGQLWVYRDGASIEEINERLGLGVSQSHYLAGLYGLATTYHVSLADAKYAKVWDPQLLLAHAATAGQLEWFVRGMVRKDARALARWVRGNLEAFAPLFAPNAREWYIEHAAHLGTALCAAPNADVQAAGLEYLEKAVPAASREGLMANGGLAGAMRLATGEGPHRARAMALVELYDAELAKDLRTPPAADAPLPEIKPPPRR